MQYEEVFFKIFKLIEDDIKESENTMTNGNIGSMEQYKNTFGKIEALTKIKVACEDFIKNLT